MKEPNATSPGPVAISLRVVVGLEFLAVFVQSALAGQFLSGDAPLLSWHETNAYIVFLLALAQLVLAIVAWRQGIPGWIAAASGGLLVAVVAQIFLGYASDTALHVPLGVAIFGLLVALFFGALRPGSMTQTKRARPKDS